MQHKGLIMNIGASHGFSTQRMKTFRPATSPRLGRVISGAILLALPLCAPPGYAELPETALVLSSGYRQDQLDWNIAGTASGTSPNVISELTWRDMDILQLKAEVTGRSPQQFYFRGALGYGMALDGENQDSDYAGDNRTLEFSRSVNGVDGSTVIDLSGALGYEISFGDQQQHALIPLLGYSLHLQNMRMTDGNQALWNGVYAQMLDPTLPGTVPLGPFSGLDSSYDSRWAGPFLGLDLLWDLREQGNAFLRLEYHWVKYHAEADWNLREDFAHPVSFEHDADGQGWVLEAGWTQPLPGDGWVWGVSVGLQRWRTGEGDTRFYLVDPAPPCNGACYSQTQLNEVNWISRTILLTLSTALD